MSTAAVLIKEEMSFSSVAQPLPSGDVLPVASDVGPYRQWNPSAVACYLRQAECDGCFYNQFFKDKTYGCNMAEAVNYLLKQVGPPDKRRIQRLV